MAATCLSLPHALGLGHLDKSRLLYNALPDDCEQPPVAENIIVELASLFVRHNAHRAFGVHLIHSHFQLPEKTVLVGETFCELGLRWAKPASIETLDLSSVHGHIFMITRKGLVPYELQEGPLPDLTDVSEGFLTDFSHYLIEHNLTDLLGLQVLGCGDSSMCELILDRGTVMVESSLAKGVQKTRVTGWKFESVDGRPRVCQANEVHSGMTSGNHKVFNAGRPHPKLENVEDLMNVLAEVGIL